MMKIHFWITNKAVAKNNSLNKDEQAGSSGNHVHTHTRDYIHPHNRSVQPAVQNVFVQLVAKTFLQKSRVIEKYVAKFGNNNI